MLLRKPSSLNDSACELAAQLPPPDTRSLLLALGVISEPSKRRRRDWLRAAAVRFNEKSSVAQLFVLGCMPPGEQRDATEAEASQFHDIAVLAVKDSVAAACVAKSFAWFSTALNLFPRARYIAKTDDDSLNNHGNLVDLLASSRRNYSPLRPLVYGGWPQFTSFLPQHNVGCGWSQAAQDALKAPLVTTLGGIWTNCRYCVNHPFCYWNRKVQGRPLNSSVIGPFVFATGALEILSAPLVRLVFESESTTRYIATQLQRQDDGSSWRRDRPWRDWVGWTCAAEDSLIGLAVYRAARADDDQSEALRASEVDFLALSGLVIDVNGRSKEEDLPGLITAHKLEVDLDHLREKAEWEVTLNERRAKWAERNGTFSRERLKFMTRLLPALEGLNASTRAQYTPAMIRCRAFGDVEAARRSPAHQPVHPSVAAFLADFPGGRGWRFCEVPRWAAGRAAAARAAAERVAAVSAPWEEADRRAVARAAAAAATGADETMAMAMEQVEVLGVRRRPS